MLAEGDHQHTARPSTGILNAILDLCTACGRDKTQLIHLLQILVGKHGVRVDRVTYNILIKAAGQRGDRDSALEAANVAMKVRQ